MMNINIKHYDIFLNILKSSYFDVIVRNKKECQDVRGKSNLKPKFQ